MGTRSRSNLFISFVGLDPNVFYFTRKSNAAAGFTEFISGSGQELAVDIIDHGRKAFGLFVNL